MEKDDILIWKYLDGECSPEERAEVERRRAEAPEFAEALRQRELLHEGLRALEAEQPSLRFAANVIDKLPALYRRAAARAFQPLVSPWAARLFLAFFALLSIVCLQAAIALTPPGGGGAYAQWVSPLTEFFQRLSPQDFSVVAALSGSLLILFALDRRLQRRRS
jgi:anti-sigma factor RsiW